MRFLLDNNLSPRLARALNELTRGSGHEVTALRERFPADTKDTQWIGRLAQEGDWAVVCGDRGILTNPIELKALRDSGLTIFFLARGWASLEHWPKAAKLVQHWPKIEATVENVLPGVCYTVQLNGKLAVI